MPRDLTWMWTESSGGSSVVWSDDMLDEFAPSNSCTVADCPACSKRLSPTGQGLRWYDFAAIVAVASVAGVFVLAGQLVKGVSWAADGLTWAGHRTWAAYRSQRHPS